MRLDDLDGAPVQERGPADVHVDSEVAVEGAGQGEDLFGEDLLLLPVFEDLLSVECVGHD